MRAPLAALGFVALVAGLAGGLARFGVGTGFAPPGSIAHHGVLVVSGFFGTVISLERAVALGASWAHAAPLAAGAGALVALAGMPGPAAALFAFAGAVFLVASVVIRHRQPAPFTTTLALGALCWAVGNTLWLAGASMTTVVPWWIAFFALTIAGERLELSRLLPPKPRARRLFTVTAAGLFVAAFAASWESGFGGILLGVALCTLAGWLAANDVARRTIRGRGLPRYAAAGLLAGYFWLFAGGLLGVAYGPTHGVALHAVMLGFVFSMVFAHAPIILPAVLRVAVPYTPWLYAPLVLLHASLAIRTLAALAGWGDVQRDASMGNAAAIALFVLVMMASALARRHGASAAH